MEFGLDALRQNIDSAKKGTGNGARIGYLGWKDGETKVIRFMSNEVISADMAEFVATNDGKSQDFMVDLAKGNFVEKYGGKTKDRATGAWVDPKLRKKGIAIAVVRDEKPLGGGRTEITDKFEMVTGPNGQQLRGRTFGVIKATISNFWKPLMAITANYEGICDRDYAITRVGDDKDTIYIPRPIEPTGQEAEALRDLAVMQQYYGYGRPWNENDPDRFMYCPQTLVEWADYYSGEERAKFWLTPKAAPAAPGAFTTPGMGVVGGYSTITAPPPQVPTPSISGTGYQQPWQPPGFPAQTEAPAAAGTGGQGLGEFHPATTHNPAPMAPHQPAPVAPPVPSVPVSASAPPFVPTPPGQPAYVPPQPQAPAPWAGNEDEAQAVPSANTSWADLQAKLLPQLAQASTEAQQTASATP